MSSKKDEGRPAMEKLIPIINQLQDVFNVLGSDSVIDLPQIVVVGSQSAGKSSVLETLCHRDILPRGSGIVTRRPLILQLHNVPEQPKGKPQEWGVFLHCKDKIFVEIDDIRAEIQAETDKLAGTGQCVVDEPIRLKLFSPYVLNLTLVDLPGIARNPVGDQPKNIEFLIKDMVQKYISKPNALILAVTAANTDLATSDAIDMSSRFDPTGERTIGVLTKIDLMDRGTDALRILTNREHPLKLGWTGVVNRSQADIDAKKNIYSAREDEMKFFRSSEIYRDIADEQGCAFLARKLNKILIRHIQKTLPGLRSKVQDLIDKYQKEMLTYGSIIDERDRGSVLLQVLTRYSTDYSNVIEGRSSSLAKNRLEGGSRIGYIFYEVFHKMLDSVDPSESYSTSVIRTVIRNASGPRMSLFFPEHVLELFARNIITRMGPPCLRCVDMVEQELVGIARSTGSGIPELQRYRRLLGEVVGTAEEMLESLTKPCTSFIKDMIDCELAYVNMMHPDFTSAVSKFQAQVQDPYSPQSQQQYGRPAQSGQGMQGGMGPKPAVPPPQSQRSRSPGKDEPLDFVPERLQPSGAWTDSEKLACDIIPPLMDRYYTVIRKKIEDTIPKAAMNFLVLRSKDTMQRTLISKLYREDRIGYFFEEDPDITRKRNECRDMLKMLRNAQGVLESIMEI